MRRQRNEGEKAPFSFPSFIALFWDDSGRRANDATRQVHCMAGAQHRRQLLAPTVLIRRIFREGADSPAAREGQRGLPRLIGGGEARGLGIGGGDPVGAKPLGKAALAIAAPHISRRPRRSEATIVDIAGVRKTLDDRVHRRRALALPAAFGELAAKIGGELRAGGGETTHIGQRESLQRRAIERWMVAI